MVLPPQFWISVRGMTSTACGRHAIATDTLHPTEAMALYGHCAMPSMLSALSARYTDSAISAAV